MVWPNSDRFGWRFEVACSIENGQRVASGVFLKNLSNPPSVEQATKLRDRGFVPWSNHRMMLDRNRFTLEEFGEWFPGFDRWKDMSDVVPSMVIKNEDLDLDGEQIMATGEGWKDEVVADSIDMTMTPELFEKQLARHTNPDNTHLEMLLWEKGVPSPRSTANHILEEVGKVLVSMPEVVVPEICGIPLFPPLRFGNAMPDSPVANYQEWEDLTLRNGFLPDSTDDSPVSASAPPVQVKDVTVRKGSKAKISDAGEKIGRARKDFHRKALCLDDLSVMTPEERTLLVKRDNIWPWSPSKALEAGVEPCVALWIRNMRRSIKPVPSSFRSDELYVRNVTELRDAVGNPKTFPELRANLLANYRNNNEYLTRPMSLDIYDAFKFVKVVEENPQGELPRAFGEPDLPDNDAALKKLLPKRSPATPDVSRKPPERPHLSNLAHYGFFEARNKDVTANELLEKFGFRAIEFGNWVSQEERQEVLNLAWDGMTALCETLGIESKQAGLSGTLALAFGSRGRGGRRAAVAHYEMERKVINLTRIKGAGSLCHEWFHALDDYLGEDCKQTSLAKQLLSEHLSASVNHRWRLFHEQSMSFSNSDKSLASFVRQQIEQWVMQKQADIEPNSEFVKKCLDSVRDTDKDFSRNPRPLEYENHLYFLLELAEKVSRIPPDQLFYPPDRFGDKMAFVGDWSDIQSILNDLPQGCDKNAAERLLYETFTMLAEVRYTLLSSSEKKVMRMNHACLGTPFHDFSPLRDYCNLSDFSRDARFYDGERRQYWQKPEELFARAAEQYVFYKMQESECRSDYLVHGVEEQPESTRSPYLRGEERLCMMQFMETYTDKIRAKIKLEKTWNPTLGM